MDGSSLDNKIENLAIFVQAAAAARAESCGGRDPNVSTIINTCDEGIARNLAPYWHATEFRCRFAAEIVRRAKDIDEAVNILLLVNDIMGTSKRVFQH